MISFTGEANETLRDQENQIIALLSNSNYREAIIFIDALMPSAINTSLSLKLAYYRIFCLFSLKHFEHIEAQYQHFAKLFGKFSENEKMILSNEERNLISYMRASSLAQRELFNDAIVSLTSLIKDNSKIYVRAIHLKAYLLIKLEAYYQALTCVEQVSDSLHERESFSLLSGIARAKLNGDTTELINFYKMFEVSSGCQPISNLLLKLNALIILADKCLEKNNFELLSNICRLLNLLVVNLDDAKETVRLQLDSYYFEASQYYVTDNHEMLRQALARYTNYFKDHIELIADQKSDQLAQLMLFTIYRSLQRGKLDLVQVLIEDSFWKNVPLISRTLRTEFLMAKIVYSIKAMHPWSYKDGIDEIMQQLQHDGSNSYGLILAKMQRWLSLLKVDELNSDLAVIKLAATLYEFTTASEPDPVSSSSNQPNSGLADDNYCHLTSSMTPLADREKPGDKNNLRLSIVKQNSIKESFKKFTNH